MGRMSTSGKPQFLATSAPMKEWFAIKSHSSPSLLSCCPPSTVANLVLYFPGKVLASISSPRFCRSPAINISSVSAPFIFSSINFAPTADARDFSQNFLKSNRDSSSRFFRERNENDKTRLRTAFVPRIETA